MIGVHCSRCGNDFQVDDQSAGKSEFCPVCAELVDVPRLETDESTAIIANIPHLLPSQNKIRPRGWPAPLFWVVACLTVGSFITALIYLSIDDWEARHLQDLADESSQAESALARHDYAAADHGFQTILDMVGGRKIQSEFLAGVIEQSRRDQAVARAGLAHANESTSADVPTVALEKPATRSGTPAATMAAIPEPGSGVSSKTEEKPAASNVSNDNVRKTAQNIPPLRGASAQIAKIQIAIERFETDARERPTAFQDEHREWRRRQVAVWDLQYHWDLEADPIGVLLKYTCASQRTAPHPTRAAAEIDNAFSFAEQVRPLKINSAYQLIDGQWILRHREADPASTNLNNIVSGLEQPATSTLFEQTGELEDEFIGIHLNTPATMNVAATRE